MLPPHRLPRHPESLKYRPPVAPSALFTRESGLLCVFHARVFSVLIFTASRRTTSHAAVCGVQEVPLSIWIIIRIINLLTLLVLKMGRHLKKIYFRERCGWGNCGLISIYRTTKKKNRVWVVFCLMSSSALSAMCTRHFRIKKGLLYVFVRLAVFWYTIKLS